jgi:hypothetical protein
MTTLFPSTSRHLDSDELLLITHPRLRAQLLRARLVDELSARCVIQRDENVYLSLREIPDEAQRQEISWAVLRLQLGAQLNAQELPDPLQTALSTAVTGPSPLIRALVWGSVCGVIGGVLIMAIVGLLMTVLMVPTESYTGFMATAVAFVLSGAILGVGATFYFWRKFSR